MNSGTDVKSKRREIWFGGANSDHVITFGNLEFLLKTVDFNINTSSLYWTLFS